MQISQENSISSKDNLSFLARGKGIVLSWVTKRQKAERFPQWNRSAVGYVVGTI